MLLQCIMSKLFVGWDQGVSDFNLSLAPSEPFPPKNKHPIGVYLLCSTDILEKKKVELIAIHYAIRQAGCTSPNKNLPVCSMIHQNICLNFCRAPCTWIEKRGRSWEKTLNSTAADSHLFSFRLGCLWIVRNMLNAKKTSQVFKNCTVFTWIFMPTTFMCINKFEALANVMTFATCALEPSPMWTVV